MEACKRSRSIEDTEVCLSLVRCSLSYSYQDGHSQNCHLYLSYFLARLFFRRSTWMYVGGFYLIAFSIISSILFLSLSILLLISNCLSSSALISSTTFCCAFKEISIIGNSCIWLGKIFVLFPKPAKPERSTDLVGRHQKTAYRSQTN